MHTLTEQKGESVKLSFALCRGEMKEVNKDNLHANMDILKAGLDTCYIFELKCNPTDSTVLHIGEAGDM